MLRQVMTLLQVLLGARPVNSAGARPRRKAMPLRLRVYIIAVCACFVSATVSSALTFTPDLSPHSVGIACGVALLIAMSRAYPVRVAPKRKMSVDTAPALTAVILLAPALGLVAAAVGMMAGEVRARGRWFQALFNSAVAGLRVGAAAYAYRAVAGIPFGSGDDLAIMPVALVTGALTLYLTSSLLVDVAAGLTLGQNPFRGWWETQRKKLPHEAVLLMLGVFAAMPANDYPWLLPVLIVPAAVVRRSLQDGFQVKSEARETLESLAEAMDLRHHRSADHSRRVAELARALARRLGLSPRDIELVADAARLRDIGEVAIAPDLLTRADMLTEEERVEVREHSVLGARMIERFPDFADCADLILHHHERWDGWGSPTGLTGTAIPLGARIIAVAETYEALIASRPYREALSPAQAREELRACAGAQLDPHVTEMLLDMLGGEQPDGGWMAFRLNPRAVAGGGGL